jgi:glucosamine--fructose-6-phosphate aminotransferase (isomerizing)
VPILLEGLRRLEYRGYDSAGIAVLNEHENIERCRSVGKVSRLAEVMEKQPIGGYIGIAHTRWATHGVPSESNAHPHICNGHIGVVHNGIIENHSQLRQQQTGHCRFTSDTDTEVIAHQIYLERQSTPDLFTAVKRTLSQLQGAYALAVLESEEPGRLVVARSGSPLVIGVGIDEYYVASDVAALLPVTQRFIFLEDGDIASIGRNSLLIQNDKGETVERDVCESALNPAAVQLGSHRHYMHKEIHEQPQAVQECLEGRITQNSINLDAFGPNAQTIFKNTKRLQLIACGTSYHAGMVARYWFEDILGLPCQVEVASEYRYRAPVIEPNTLFITISQSGETADTLAALKEAKACQPQLHTMTICNVPESSLVRESEIQLFTHAGPEIGVASTKAFTTQLVALALLLLGIGKIQQRISQAQEQQIVEGLRRLPMLIQNALTYEGQIKELAINFSDVDNALFLGRGTHFPIALEGALKLKEISYIHAEAYPAGELKHGPLALVDEKMPVVVVAPNDNLIEKLKANLQEVKARGGRMLIFTDHQVDISPEENSGMHVVPITKGLGRITAPIIHNIPLQLLAYHVALIKGTDVDQPRNLAKSVTVE